MALSFIKAAKADGLRRVVFSSAIRPVIGVLQDRIQKVPVEGALTESGVHHSASCRVLPELRGCLVWRGRDGVLAEPFSVAMRISRVDCRDVGDIAAVALTEARLLNGIFELCANGGMNRVEVAAAIGEVLGSCIEAAAPDFGTWISNPFENA